MEMNEKVMAIRQWLQSGSVNIFGLPMSGKDTVGAKLADVLGGRFLSSGDILREVESVTGEMLTRDGHMAPTDRFREIVLPYFGGEELVGLPLVLSSIGRWSGEEDDVMRALDVSSHPLQAVLLLDVSEADVWERWETARILADRGGRVDDENREIFETRLAEFRNKTAPVLLHYEELGLLIHCRADGTRDEVFANAVDGLWTKANIQGQTL